MPALLAGIFFTVAAGMSAQPQSIPEMAGAWSGKVSIGPASLNIVFNFGKDRDGNLTCTMESPDQGFNPQHRRIVFRPFHPHWQ